MGFHLLDMHGWERKEYYRHYMSQVVCSYSLTVNLDITNLDGQKLYPAMLWLLTDTVNGMREFRTALTPEGVGIYDDLHPSYTIFNKENKNFSVVWTPFHREYSVFLKAYQRDAAAYASSARLFPKENKPPNTFDVSMLPWTTFSAFNINVFGEGKHLLPIFTMGRAFPENGRQWLPLAVQVHHAVCDGYHAGLFVEGLQSRISRFAHGV